MRGQQSSEVLDEGTEGTRLPNAALERWSNSGRWLYAAVARGTGARR